MAKNESLASIAVSAPNQQAIVNIALNKSKNKIVVLPIPGGKTLFTDKNDKDLDELSSCLYNWLRRVPSFKDCTLSFVKDTTKYKTSNEHILDFPTAGGAVWNVPSKGKSYLARALAEQIIKGGMVSITARLDGIHILRDLENKLAPGSDDWEPTMFFTRDKSEQYSLN
jgi:hypothetical protein